MPSNGNFLLKYEGKYNDIIPIKKYQSTKTGLQVVQCDIDGPVVEGYFFLATEAHDDDGLPHTLEHLVFMGSKKYPYKGILDLFANRCLASGTNAWTDTDHTCYTMTTAGDQGFLNLLPIYLDHILNPTLTSSAYLTEVHHINGDGENAGVVYCEMQACENTSSQILIRKMLNLLYPNSGYCAETGGKLLNLRESTSHKKVCDYHHEFYRSENMSILIAGIVDSEKLFKIMNNFEQNLPEKNSSFKRPWSDPVAPLTSSHCESLFYPADTELQGEAMMSWRVAASSDRITLAAISILLTYFTDTPISPMQRDFVESEDAFCANVSYSIIEATASCAFIRVRSVELSRLEDVQNKLCKLLARFVEGDELFDEGRLKDLLNSSKLKILSDIEDRPCETVSSEMICDFLYGSDNSETDVRLGNVAIIEELMKKKIQFWIDLLKKFFYNKPSVFLIGRPSIELMKKMADEEQSRVQLTEKQLGQDGLNNKEKELKDACVLNEIAPPPTLVASVNVPDVSLVQFHPLNTATNKRGCGVTKDFLLQSVTDAMPLHTNIDNIASSFINIEWIMDCQELVEDYSSYFSLFSLILLESPILVNGVTISHSEIIKRLAADTIDVSCSQAFADHRYSLNSFPDVVSIEAKCTRENYDKVVALICDILRNLVIDCDRIRTIANKMLKSVKSAREKGPKVVRAILNQMVFNNDSSIVNSSIIKQQNFLENLLEQLKCEKGKKKILQDLEHVHKCMLSNIRIHMSMDIKATTISMQSRNDRRIQSIWNEKFTGCSTTSMDVEIKRSSHMYNPQWEKCVDNIVLGVGSVESSYFVQCTKSISDYDNLKEIACTRVYIQYLSQLEGPLWKSVRGLGLAYNYNIYLSTESGLLVLILGQSTHVAKAYKVTKEIIENYISGELKIDKTEFESCKSSLMFELINTQKTASQTSVQSLWSYLTNTPHSRNKKLLDEISKVTVDDMKTVGGAIVKSLFDQNLSKVALVCNPSKVDDIIKDFKESGLNFTSIESMDSKFPVKKFF